MRKGILGVFALAGVFLFSQAGWADNLLSNLKQDVDDQCVINCLQDDGQSSGECKRADVIACRESCNLPPPATLFVGGIAFNPDTEDPGKIKGIFENALFQLGLTDKDAQTVISFPTNNPLADLGINPAIVGILTLLSPNFQVPTTPDLGNIVVAQGELPCLATKSFTFPSGNKGIGCREVRKFGATGWAAQGCGTQATAIASGSTWYGDWSTFCCNALGRPCPTCALQPGYGVCSVNSTVGGDGEY